MVYLRIGYCGVNSLQIEQGHTSCQFAKLVPGLLGSSAITQEYRVVVI